TVQRLPVVAHELARPLGLVHGPPRSELDHEGLDVEHRRAVDGIEAPNPQLEAVDLDQLAPADPHAVGAALAPLGEDAHLRKVRIATGAAGAAGHVCLVDKMEEVHDLEVRELFEAEGGVW